MRRIKRYSHELADWPNYHWDQETLAKPLAAVSRQQARLFGHMAALGFPLQQEAALQTLTADVIKTSEIEGEKLDQALVRSSIARRLGIDMAGLKPVDRNIEGIVEMMLDATGKFDQPLTVDRLFGWHASLFPTGHGGMVKIVTGAWRDDSNGPMQVVSGPIGRETVHYEAPPARRLRQEMKAFLAFYNKDAGLDPLLKAALAHLWFVTVHPFEDGNGRIARAIADMQLARPEASAQRFYSMSAQIREEREDYYKNLQSAQHSTMDITPWMEWFLACLGRAIVRAQDTLAGILKKARCWEAWRQMPPLNERQAGMLNRLLDGFEGDLTTVKWAKIGKCSHDTALRDIQDLLTRGVLARNPSGGRSTSYSLAEIR